MHRLLDKIFVKVDDAPEEQIVFNEGEKEVSRTLQFTEEQIGEHTIAVKAYDKRKNVSEATYPFVIRHPHIEILSPPQNSMYNNQKALIDFKVIDNDLKSVKYTLGSQTVEVPLAGKTEVHPLPFEFTEFGEHVLKVEATDEKGHAASEERRFTIKHDPELEISSAQAADRSYTVTYKATDGKGDMSVEVLVDGKPERSYSNAEEIEDQVHITAVGKHKVAVIARHQGDSQVFGPQTCSFEITAGQPHIDAKVVDKYYLTKEVQITITDDGNDLSGVRIWRDGGKIYDITAFENPGKFVCNMLVYGPRSHVVHAVAKDKAGNIVDHPPILVQFEDDPPPRPDESYDVSGPHYEPSEMSPVAGTQIGILQTGNCSDLAALLGSFGQNADLIAPEAFSASLAQRYRLFLIPSGGLQPMSNLEGFRDKLAGYVTAGGKLIVLTQSSARDFEVLPGPVSGLGYVEDIACHNLTGGIIEYRPCFAGQTDTTVDGYADGVLTTWPEGATALLRRIKTGFPALLAYDLGRGTVITSTYYSDFGFSHSQLNEDERRMLRDLVLWASAPNSEISEIKPGQSITLSVPISALLQTETGLAAFTRFVLRDPNGKLVSVLDSTQAPAPGQTANLSYLFDDTAGSLSQNGAGLGIWSINYELISQDGRVVQAERVALRVALSRHLQESQTQALAATIAGPTVSPFGTPIPFKIILANRDTMEHTIRCTAYNNPWADRNQCGQKDVTVPAGASIEADFPVVPVAPNLNPALSTWYRFGFVDESGRRFASEVRSVYVYAPRAKVSYTCDNLTRPGLTVTHSGATVTGVQPGDRIRIAANIESLGGSLVAGQWRFVVKNPGGAAMFEEEYSLTLEPGGTAAKTFEFSLPESLNPGYYKYSLTCVQEKGTAWIESSGPEGFVELYPDFAFDLLEQNIDGSVRVRAKNISQGSFASHVSCLAVTGETETELASFDIPVLGAGESKEFQVKLDPSHFFGDRAREAFVMRWGDASWTRSITRPMPFVAPILSITEWSGKSGSPLRVMAGIQAIGQLSGAVNLALRFPNQNAGRPFVLAIPSSGQISTEVVTFETGGLSSGAYPVILEASNGTSVLASTRLTVEIGCPVVGIALVSQGDTQTGSQLILNAINTGGSPVSAGYTLTLKDHLGKTVAAHTGEVTLPLDTPVPLAVPIPAGLISGVYQLTGEFKDLSGGKMIGTRTIALTVDGVSGQVVASVSQNVYPATEPAALTGLVRMGPANGVQGNLHMEVIRTNTLQSVFGPGWGMYGGGVDRRFTTQGTADFLQPGIKWRGDARWGPVAVGQVLPGGGRQLIVGTPDGVTGILDAANGQFLQCIFDETTAITLCDVNRDGTEEILLAVDGWWENDSVALYSASALLWSFSVGGGILGVPAAADLNGDGQIEVFVSTTAGFYLLNGSNGQVLKSTPAIQGLRWYGTTVCDLNGDGRQEIILTNSGLNQQSGYCLALTGELNPVWQSAGEFSYAPAAAADLNNDGSPELIVPLKDFGVAVLEAETGQTLWSWKDWSYKYGTGGDHLNAAVGDINGDGTPEILLGLDNGIQALSATGLPLWSCYLPRDGYLGKVTLVTDPAGKRVMATTGQYAIDAKTGVPLWRNNGIQDDYAVADVDGDQRLEIVGAVCIDTFEPFGTTTVVQAAGTAVPDGANKSLPSTRPVPYRASDGSLWFVSSGGLSYLDPIGNQFGTVPFSGGFPYFPIDPNWVYFFADGPEGLAVFAGPCQTATGLDRIGIVDTQNKILKGTHQTGFSAKSDPHFLDGWLEWEGKHYKAECGYSGCKVVQEGTIVPVSTNAGPGGVVGVGPGQTVYALAGNILYGYSFTQRTLYRQTVPITATASFNGAVQVSTNRCLIIIPTGAGKILYAFDPLALSFTRVASEDELWAAFGQTVGQPSASCSIALASGSNGAGYVLLSDGWNVLPHVFTVAAGSTTLQYIGAFLGRAGVSDPHAFSDGSLTFLTAGEQYSVKTVLPGGGEIVTRIPYSPNDYVSRLKRVAQSLNGDYLILVRSNEQPKFLLHRISRSGVLQTLPLPALDYWDVRAIGAGADPDLIYILGGGPPNNVAGLWSYRLSTGSLSQLAQVEGTSLLVDMDGTVYVSNWVDLYEYRPGSILRRVGTWGYADIALVGKDGNRLMAVAGGDSTSLLELRAMDLTSGQVQQIGAADPSGTTGEPVNGAAFCAADRMIYFARGTELWRWDALLVPGNTLPASSSPGDVVEEVIWSEDYPIHVPAGGEQQQEKILGNLAPGQYILKVRVMTDQGQLLGRSIRPFTVAGGGIAGLVCAPGEPVKVGSTQNIDATIVNTSVAPASVESVTTLQMTGSDPVELNRTTTVLAAGQTLSLPCAFQIDKPGSGVITLEIWSGGQAIGTYRAFVQSAEPQVEAGVDAPSEVGRNAFSARAWVRNTGVVKVSLVLESTELGVAGEIVSLAPGEQWSRNSEISVTGDTSLKLQVSGDWDGQVAASVSMVELVHIHPEVESIYPDGPLAPGLLLTNIGKLPSRFSVVLTLTGDCGTVAQCMRDISLGVNEAVGIQLPGHLTPGNYTLTWSSPFMSGAWPFVVRTGDAASVSGMLHESGPDLLIDSLLSNLGLRAIDGQLEITTPTDRSVQGVTLAPGESKTLTWAVPAPLQEGEHSIDARLVVNGRILAEWAGVFTRRAAVSPKADFRVSGLPEDLILATGVAKPVNIVVKNEGLAAGRVLIGLIDEDLPARAEVVELQPGEERAISFILEVPIDRESGMHRVRVVMGDTEIGAFTYQLQGIRLEVAASTDKPAYREGDTVVLSLQIAKVSGASEIPLRAKVRLGDYEETREFTLSGSENLSFSVPARCFGQKLFYGFYYGNTERSLHLNTLYVYKDDPAALILADKQVYKAGETVVLKVTPHLQGEYVVEGPNGFRQVNSVDEASLGTAFTVPIALAPFTPSGTCSIFVNTPGDLVRHDVDVQGVHLELIASELDKRVYEPGAPVQAVLEYSSNIAVSGTVAVEDVAPDAKVTMLATQAFSFVPGKNNKVSLTLVPLNSLAGVHKLHIRLCAPDGTNLVSGSVYYRIGQIEIERIELAKTEYATLGEPVTGTLALNGSGAGTIKITVDERVVQTLSTELSGPGHVSFSIPSEAIPGPGIHVIQAMLNCGMQNTVSQARFSYGSDLPDLSVVRIEAGKEPVEDRYLPVVVTVQKLRRQAVEEVDVLLTTRTGGESLVVARGKTGPFPEGEDVATVEFLWDISEVSGDLTLEVTLNPEGLQPEFDFQNNKLTTSLHISHCPVIELPEYLGHNSVAVTGEAEPDTKVILLVNSREAGRTDADDSGHFVFSNVLMQEGVNLVTAQTVDLNGRLSLSASPKAVLVDTIPPRIHLAGVTDGLVTNQSVNISVNVEEANPAEVSMSVDGQSFAGNASVSAEGDHTLVIQASDVVGHTAVLSVTFTIDKTAPDIQVPGLIEGGTYEVPLKIAVTVGEQHPGETLIMLDEKTYVPGSPIEEFGDHTLYVKSTDQAGNSAKRTIHFAVKPKLTASLKLRPAMRTLIFSDWCAGGETEQLILRAFSKMGVTAHTVGTADEFLTGMRSGEYNSFIILDGAKTMNAPKEREVMLTLKQRIILGDTGIYMYAGQGGDTPHYFGRGDSTPFPGRFVGMLPPQDWSVSLVPDALSMPGPVTVKGKCLRIEVEDAAVLGTVAKNGTWPVLYTAPLGNGYAAVMAFDPAACRDTEVIKALINQICMKVMPNVGMTSDRLIPYSLAVTNLSTNEAELNLNVIVGIGNRLVEVRGMSSGGLGRVMLAPGQSLEVQLFVAVSADPADVKIELGYWLESGVRAWGAVSLIQ